MKHKILMTIGALAVAAGLQAQVKVAKPEDHGMDPERLARVDAVIADAIGAGDIPGAVLAVVRRNDIVYQHEQKLLDHEHGYEGKQQ